MIDDKMIKFLFQMVKMTPFIQGNPSYLKSAEATTALFNKSNVVNAYANSDYGGENHWINIYSGICNMSLVAGYGLAANQSTGLKVSNTFRVLMHEAIDVIKNKVDEDGHHTYEFSFEDSIRVINKHIPNITEKITLDAESFAYGCIVSILGHELGHICLHHTVTASPDAYTYTISRNNERCADLFAANVITTTPFTSYMVIADLMVNIFLAWFGNGRGKATTHPYSRERAEYIYNSHIETLTQYGITQEAFDSLMPPKTI